MPFCEYCQLFISKTALFCSHCRKKVATELHDYENEDDFQILSSSPQIFKSRQSDTSPKPQSKKGTHGLASVAAAAAAAASAAQATQDILVAKEKARIRDHKERSNPPSNFDILRQSTSFERRQVELWIFEQGSATIQLGNAVFIDFNPYEHVENLSQWVKEQAKTFQGWIDRKDPETCIEDYLRVAWIGIPTGNSKPVQIKPTVEEDEKLNVGKILKAIGDPKARIAFCFPIKVINSSDFYIKEENNKSTKVQEIDNASSTSSDNIKKTSISTLSVPRKILKKRKSSVDIKKEGDNKQIKKEIIELKRIKSENEIKKKEYKSEEEDNNNNDLADILGLGTIRTSNRKAKRPEKYDPSPNEEK